jgi:hypothetical protein
MNDRVARAIAARTKPRLIEVPRAQSQGSFREEEEFTAIGGGMAGDIDTDVADRGMGRGRQG